MGIFGFFSNCSAKTDNQDNQEFCTVVSHVGEIERPPRKMLPQPQKQRSPECRGPSFFKRTCCPFHDDYGSAKDRKIDVRLRFDGVWDKKLLRVSANMSGLDFTTLASEHLQ